MHVPSRRHRPLIGTRNAIVNLLRRAPMTASRIAEQLHLTHNAVRGHLAALMSEGIVGESSLQPSGGRPAVLYEIRPEAESRFSRAYLPFAAHLMRVLQQRLDEGDLTEIMRAVGRSLSAEFPRARGDLSRRVQEASALLTALGSLNDVEAMEGGFVLRAHGCALGEAVHERPDVCRALETLLAETLEVPVHERCERGERPRCRFEIAV